MMSNRGPYMAVADRLEAMRSALADNDPMPSWADTALAMAATIIKGHGELVQRVKAAIGPELCRAARVEAEAVALGWTPPRDPTPEEIEPDIGSGAARAVGDFLAGKPKRVRGPEE